MYHRRAVEGWVKRAERQPVNLAATAATRDAPDVRVQISNISLAGCQIESDHSFRVGEAIVLSIAGMPPLKAQVRWAIAGMAGAQFSLESASEHVPDSSEHADRASDLNSGPEREC